MLDQLKAPIRRLQNDPRPHPIRRVDTQSMRDVSTGSIARLIHHASSSPKLWLSRWWVPAQRYSELVADLAPDRAGLGETQMVGIGRASAANQTGVGRHELEMAFVAMPLWLADGELAFPFTVAIAFLTDDLLFADRKAHIGRPPTKLDLKYRPRPSRRMRTVTTGANPADAIFVPQRLRVKVHCYRVWPGGNEKSNDFNRIWREPDLRDEPR
jgi:hypothetical protein